jgi:hypothetical protein
MPTPVEICLEDLALSPEDERFLRCVALPGGEPGLALDSEGSVRWMPPEPADCGLWVSEDDRLVLLRAEGAAPVTVSRGGRTVEAPEARPVVLRDQDLITINDRQLRLHVHGVAGAVHPPEPLTAGALGRMVRAAGMALALGAAVGASSASAAPATGGPTAPIEVRTRPPAPPAAPQVVCAIARMAKTKEGVVMVHATCPKPGSTPGTVRVGDRGYIVDPKSNAPAKYGNVVVKKVKGVKVVAESRLKQPIKATQVRIYTRY